VIASGRFSGQVVKIAIAVPADYPQTPPGGLYVSPKLIPANEMQTLHIQDRQETSGLPGEWQYWSRPIKDWTGENPARRIVQHWSGVMFHV
jgi:hypothetical protein